MVLWSIMMTCHWHHGKVVTYLYFMMPVPYTDTTLNSARNAACEEFQCYSAHAKCTLYMDTIYSMTLLHLKVNRSVSTWKTLCLTPSYLFACKWLNLYRWFDTVSFMDQPIGRNMVAMVMKLLICSTCSTKLVKWLYINVNACAFSETDNNKVTQFRTRQSVNIICFYTMLFSLKKIIQNDIQWHVKLSSCGAFVVLNYYQVSMGFL